jgi:hypothetical protein
VSDKLELNILVPEIQSTSQASANGTLTYMLTEAYSPYFSNVGDVAIWFTFHNGASVPVGQMYEVRDDRGGPGLTIKTDRAVYERDSDSIIVSGQVRNDTITKDYQEVRVVIHNDMAIPHQYHSGVVIKADGTFLHTIPIRGNLPTDGNYTVSVSYRGQEAETTVTIGDGVIGDFSSFSQGIPQLKNGTDLVISNSESRAKVGVNYTLTIFLKSDDRPITSNVPIVEIRNSVGITEELFVNPGYANKSLGRSYVTAYWLPKYPDTYSVNTFIISDLKNPTLLTGIRITYFEVE